jgi:uncharacterized protein
MLTRIESVVFFVADIHAAARWYADLFGVAHEKIEYENANYAFIRARGLLVGFHPADEKSPSGVGGTTSYWSVDDLEQVRAAIIARGARLYRGPATTDLGDRVCMLLDPFGNSIGLHQANATS